MTEPVFVRILKKISDRITSISVANGYHLDLGGSVQIEGLGPVDLDNDGQPLPGNVAIEPGAVSSSIGEGESDNQVRMRTVPMEAIYERNPRIIMAIPIDADKVDTWLLIAEQAGEDLRKAIYADEYEWIDLNVTRLAQSELQAQRPQAGSRVLMVAVTFTIRYHS